MSPHVVITIHQIFGKLVSKYVYQPQTIKNLSAAEEILLLLSIIDKYDELDHLFD